MLYCRGLTRTAGISAHLTIYVLKSESNGEEGAVLKQPELALEPLLLKDNNQSSVHTTPTFLDNLL